MASSIVKTALKNYPEDAKLIASHLDSSKKTDDYQYAYNLVGASLTRQKIGHGLEYSLGALSKDFTGDSWNMNFWNPARSSQERVLALLQNRNKIVEGDMECKRCRKKRFQIRVLRGRSDEAQTVKITCIHCGYETYQS